MAFSFDDLREKVTDLAHSGVAKSKQLAEIAKLKTSNMGEEDTKMCIRDRPEVG